MIKNDFDAETSTSGYSVIDSDIHRQKRDWKAKNSGADGRIAIPTCRVAVLTRSAEVDIAVAIAVAISCTVCAKETSSRDGVEF